MFNYSKNILRSTTYALPQIIKNRIPSVANLVDQFTDKGQRETTTAVFQEMKGILREDVFGLMKKGLSNATREIKSGKLYQTEEEQHKVFGEAMDMDESLFDNSFLTASDGQSSGDDSDGMNDGLRATASVASSAAAAGAAQGVMAAASQLGDGPAQRATAEAGYATARFARANLGASLAVGNMLRGAVMANAQVLTEIHKFQVHQQQSFYEKQLEHNQSMAVMTSELISKISSLQEVSAIAASASDQLMAAFQGRESEFAKIFGHSGNNFSANAYLGTMASRFKQSVGDGSLFKQIGTNIAAAPMAQAFSMALESLIPKDFDKQFKQFNDFVGNLGILLNERAGNLAKRMKGKGGTTGLFGSLLGKLTVNDDTDVGGAQLSNIVRGKAVAFDGYAHRSIVEVIPGFLSDIHAELVAARRATGAEGPKDRKGYNFETGRFVSEETERRRINKETANRANSHLDGVRSRIADGGDKTLAKSNRDSLRIMRDKNFTIQKGNAEAFGSQLDELIEELESSGSSREASTIRASRASLVAARQKHGARFSADYTAAAIKSNSAKNSFQQDNIAKEGVHRSMYSNQVLDSNDNVTEFTANVRNGTTRAAGGSNSLRNPSFSGTPGSGAGAIDVDDEYISLAGDGTEFAKSRSQSIFKDADGKVTIKSLLRAPLNAVSKAMDSFESKVSDIFFGDGDGKKGLFKTISQSLFGEKLTNGDGSSTRNGGMFGGIINTFNKKIFDPLKNAIIGDPNDPSSNDKSVVGTMKRWFGEAVEGGKRFLFGNTEVDADGETQRRGGLFGGIVNWFSGKSKQLKEMLLGKGDDGKNPGLLTGLKMKFDNMVERVQKSLFGSLDESGRRSGGAFGDSIQKGKDFVSGLWDKFQETAVKPLAQTLFGTVDQDGRRSGGLLGGAMQKGKDFVSKLWSDTQTHILRPMGEALMGKRKIITDDYGNQIDMGREGGILPTLWNTFRSSVIEPLAESLMGKKGADGTRVGGALPAIWTSIKDAFAPLKETFVGEDGIWTKMKKGLSDTFRDLKKSLFGGKDGEEDKPFMERIGEKLSDGIRKVGEWLQNALKPVTGWIKQGGEWLRTKVFEPFNGWLNDPKTGFITRMREGTASFFYGKKNEDGAREGGLFGAVKKGMDKFFYGDPNDPASKGFVERVVEPAKKFVLEEIWSPLKKSVNDMWEGTKSFFSNEILAPLKGVIDPFVTEAKEQWRLMKEWVSGPLWDSLKNIGSQLNDSMKGVFGKSFTEMMRENIIDPVKQALSGVRKFLGDTLKAVFKFPVNVLRGVSDELAQSQIKRGVFKGSAAERDRLMGKFGMNSGDVPAGQGSSINRSATTATPGAAATPGVTNAAPKSLWERMKEAVGQGSTSTTSGSGGSSGGVTSVSATMGATPGSSSSSSPAAGSSTTSGGSVGGAVSKSIKNGNINNVIDATTATADNTHNLYQFVKKHLWGVGKNVERIAKHIGVKSGKYGGNTDESRPDGVLGKLKELLMSPITFIKKSITNIFNKIKNIGSQILTAAKNLIMVPLKLIGKGLQLASSILVKSVKAIAPLVGVLKDALVNTLVTAVQLVSSVVKTTVSALGSAIKSVAEAVPSVLGALTSATVGILKTGASLASGIAEVLGSLTLTLVKVGATMIETAVSVTKDIVTSIARVAFDAIGGMFNMITGKRGSGAMAALTPVFVVGGFLADTKGGATTLSEAKLTAGGSPRRILRAASGAAAGVVSGFGPIGALLGAGLGFFSPELAERVATGKASIVSGMKRVKDRVTAPFTEMSNRIKDAKGRVKGLFNGVKDGFSNLKDTASGGWEAVKNRTAKARDILKDGKWKDRLLGANEKAREHLGSLRSGFSSFGKWMGLLIPMLVSGIGTLVTFFTKGKFISMLSSLVSGGGGMLKAGGRMLQTGYKALGGMKGLGIAAAAGLGGMAVKGLADEYMDDGAAKTAVKTGGSMLQYGAMGATIGSVIPGVGTAIGAGVGAAVGAAVENWDSIVGAAKSMWTATKKAGKAIASATSWLGTAVKTVGSAVWSSFFGNDIELDENGKVIRQEKSNLIGRMWQGLVGSDEKVLADGQVAREGGIGVLGNVQNMLLNGVSIFGKMLSGEDWNITDLAKGTVLDGVWDRMGAAIDSFTSTLMSIGSAIYDGFKYITSGEFVAGVWKSITGWFTGETVTGPDGAVSSGASGVAAPADNRSFFQKIGQSISGWADSNKATVKTVTVDASGDPLVANRAFGGKLGRNGTLVGELGPELLDANGNVIPMDGMQNPALGAAAQTRGNSIASILQDIQQNTFYTAKLLESMNGAIGGNAVKLSNAANDSVFEPGARGTDTLSKKPGGVLGVLASAFNISPATGDSIRGVISAASSSLQDATSSVREAVTGAGSQLWAGAKSSMSSAMSGNFSEAASTAGTAVRGAANSMVAGARGVFGSISDSAAGVGAAITGNAGKNVEMLRAFMSSNGVTNPSEQAMFLAQLDHESGGFKTLSENLRYRPSQLLKTFPKYFRSEEDATAAAAAGPETIANRVYGGRMGNKESGDGFKFRGRGFIQLTGRDNYTRAGKDLNLDLVNNPDLAAIPENAAKIALWFWNKRGVGKPARAGDITEVTRLINGGSNGLDDRKSKFSKYMGMVNGPAMAGAGGPIKTAMLGGFLSNLPTLVGEREPEILGPDGQIHRSVDSYLNSPNSDVSGLASSTAIKEAMRRSGKGGDHGGANEALNKIAAAASSSMGGSDDLMKQMIAVLQQIAGNTSQIGQLGATGTTGNNSVNLSDASSRSSTNVFALGQPKQAQSVGGMSPSMHRVVSGA